MAELPFTLTSDERLLLASHNVKMQGYAGRGESGDLYLTNLSIIAIPIGFFGSVKEIRRYNLKSVDNVSVPYENESTLVFHYRGDVFSFTFTQNEKHEIKIWPMAIHDMRFADNAQFDYAYYQRFYKIRPQKIVKKEEPLFTADGVKFDKQFAKDMAKSMIFSGNYSLKGLEKSYKKAVKKQSRRELRDSILDSDFVAAVRDETEIDDLEDVGIEVLNAVREKVGLKPKKTNEDLKKEGFEEAFSRAVKQHRPGSDSSQFTGTVISPSFENKVHEKPIVNNKPTQETRILIDPKSPLTSVRCIGKDYKAIEKEFRNAGFYNIITVPREKPRGFFARRDGHPDKSVFSISIDGNKNYLPGEYSPGASITITYHSENPTEDDNY